MSNVPTIHNARDYVNYVFNISTRGIAEVTSEIFGLSSTVQNVLGNLAFKTSEYLSHAEATTVGFGIAAVGAYVGATKRAIEFQQATANVEAISGKQLIGSDVGAQAMEMSNKFGMAIEDMTSGLEALARAGVTAKSSINALLESGTQMAKFEGTDLETSMNDLMSTVNLLTADMDSNSEEYAQRVKEINQHIISTSESSPINAQNIINSLQHVGGYASSTNLDQDDLFAVIAQLGSKGTKGEITGTSLRAFVSAGQKDTAQRALKRIGLNVNDLWDDTGESILSISQMKDVLDSALEAQGYSKQQKLEFYSDFVGYKQANQIMKIDTSEVEHYRQAIDNAMSLTDKMNITLGTVQGNWSQIANTALNFMTKVGSKLLPIINAILIPVKMIVGFIDKVPFADWIVGAGLGFVAIKGIAKAIQVLVPTMLTFIYKFTDLKKSSFDIRNIFEKWKEDLKEAKDILASMGNREKMEEIVDKREAEHTNKYLLKLNEQDAINEYMRQKFGVKTERVGNKHRNFFVWDRMSETQREYYRNKYRPPEETIQAFIEHRKNWFEQQWANASNTWEPSSGEWPRGNASHEDSDSFFGDDFNSDVLNYYEEFYGFLYRITNIMEENFNTTTNNNVESSSVHYNPSNRERNAEILKQKIHREDSNASYRNWKPGEPPRNKSGELMPYLLSDDDWFDRHYKPVINPSRRMATINLADFSANGQMKIGDKKYNGGLSGSSDKGGIINIYPGTIKYHVDNNSEDYGNNYGNALLETIIHELSHTILAHGERTDYGNPYIDPDDMISKTKSKNNVLGYYDSFVEEYEANAVVVGAMKRLGIEPSHIAQQRMIKFKEIVDDQHVKNGYNAEAIQGAIDALVSDTDDLHALVKYFAPQFDMAAAGTNNIEIMDSIRNALIHTDHKISGVNHPYVNNKKGQEWANQIIRDMVKDIYTLNPGKFSENVSKDEAIKTMLSQKYLSVMRDQHEFDTAYKIASSIATPEMLEAYKKGLLDKFNPNDYSDNALMEILQKSAQDKTLIADGKKGFSYSQLLHMYYDDYKKYITEGANPARYVNGEQGYYVDDAVRDLDELIKSSVGLIANQKVYHGGTLNTNEFGLGVLDLRSLSYDKKIADQHGAKHRKGDRYTITAYAPEDSQLILPSENILPGSWFEFEHELTSGIGQPYIELSRDDEKRTAEILLLTQKNVQEILNLHKKTKNRTPKEDSDDIGDSESVLNILKGTIGSSSFADLSNYQMIYNRASSYDPRNRKVPETVDDIIKNLEDYYEYGRFYINNQKKNTLGASLSETGEYVYINAKALSEYDNTEAIQTTIHELTHMLLSPYERKPNANGKTLYNPDAERTGDRYGNTSYNTKDSHIGTEAEANIAQIVTANMLGHGSDINAENHERLQWMLYHMDESEDINLDLINPLVNEAINNTEAVFAPMVEKLRKFRGSPELKRKANKVADDIQKYIDESKQSVAHLENLKENGVNFSDITVSGRDLYGMWKSQDAGRRSANDAADVFNLSQGAAAARIISEKERMKQKINEFRSNNDTVFNAYKKSIVTSAMTEDGRKFAVEKNQRQLFDFLNNGLTNLGNKDPSNVQNYFKGGIFKTLTGGTQWDLIQRHFAGAKIEYTSGKWKDDDFLRSFGGLSPGEFLEKYNALTREADKMRVMDALLNYGQMSANAIIDTRVIPNKGRRNLITETDYENIAAKFGIDFSSTKNKEEKYEILRNWLKNNRGREDEVTSILMEHEDVLAKTMESATHESNLKFLQALQASGQYDVSGLITDFMKDSHYSHFKLYDKLKKEFFLTDESGNYLSDEQQPLLQFSKQFWGDWAEFGKATQYELAIHFAEIEKLAQRAEVSVNDFNDTVGTVGGGGSRTSGTSSGSSSGTSDTGSSGSESGGNEGVSEERREQIRPQMEKLQAFVDKFYGKLKNVSHGLFGHYVRPKFTATSYGGHASLDSHYIPPTNRVTKYLYDKLKDVDTNLFKKQIDEVNDRIDATREHLELWRDAFNEVGQVFPPFIAAGMALQAVIEGLTVVTTILTAVESGLYNMRELKGIFSIFKDTELGGVIQGFGTAASKALGSLGSMISSFVMSLVPLAGVILPVIAAIVAVVAALKLSQDSHDKYLESLKKEQKEITAEDKANQALYKSVEKQRYYGYKNKAAKNFGDIQYEVAVNKLHASNLKRRLNAIKIAEQEADGLWGTYGERARLQKMDWGQSIGAYGIPLLGTIAKYFAGEFESTAEQYTGTTEQIRKIKESTLANPKATGAQRMVAAYYDANQAQFAMMDNYKSELGELYDTETKLINMYGTKEAARNNAIFKKAVKDFEKATGIDAETAKKMLDYMQVEHNVETASTAMQAQVDSIVSDTELKALAAANGADANILLNGTPEEQTKLMVQAQADMIKQQAADSLWWKGVWSSVSAIFWQFMSPITLIYNLLLYIWAGVSAIAHAVGNPVGTFTESLGLGGNDALRSDLQNMQMAEKGMANSVGDFFGSGPEAQKSRMYWEGYNTLQNEDLYKTGMSAVSQQDRANYGKGTGTLGGSFSAPAKDKINEERMAKAEAEEQKKKKNTEPVQSTTGSWWDLFFNTNTTTTTMKSSSQTASAQTETTKSDMYWQGYNTAQQVEVINQDESAVALQNISNEVIGIGAVGLIARRYNIGASVSDIGNILKVLSKNDMFTQGIDLIKSIVKSTKDGGSSASSAIKSIAKILGIDGTTGVKTVAETGANTLKDALEQVTDTLDNIETLNDLKEAYHENGLKGAFGRGLEKIKTSEKYNKLKDFILGKEVEKPTGRVKVGIDAPNERIMETTREGGVLSKIKNLPKTIKNVYAEEGLKGFYMRGANRVKGLSPYSKTKDFLFGKEVEVPSGRVKVGIDAPNERIMTTTREGGALSKIKGGIQDINVKDLWSRGKTGGKEVLRAASKDVGGWEGLLSTTKSGMIEAMNPRTAVTGFKEMGAGLRGSGTLLKGASKVAGPAAAILGGALTFMEEYEEHDPSQTHYNEDGTEKKAFQSAGEVAGSTVGAAAGGLGGAILGAEAGAALGTAIAPGIGTAIGGVAGGIIGGIVGEETMRQWGDAIGGTLGWVGDQLWSMLPDQGKEAWNTVTQIAGDAWTKITDFASSAWDTITGFGNWLNDVTGGVSGQVWDTLVGTNDQSDRLVKGVLAAHPIGAGINFAYDMYNWLAGDNNNQNTTSYQPQTADAVQKGVEQSQKNKRTQGTKTSIVIENININTEDDPEKIKTALMNLIIELQEQVSPRMVSRTVGEPAQASSDTEEDNKTKEEEEALKKQQSGSSTTTTLS